MVDQAENGRGGGSVVPYGDRLSADSRWALIEGSIYFEGRGAVHETLRRIAKRLDELGVAYAVVGGLALFHHGARRFTEDVDLLVTREGLRTIHERLDGSGYVAVFAGSKNLRDVQTGVKIEFWLSGAFPGDGKVKPMAFPAPTTCGVEIAGVRYIGLEGLMEMKIASGMTAVSREKDLVDVVALINALKLPREVGERLNTYVREKYGALWELAQAAREDEERREWWDNAP